MTELRQRMVNDMILRGMAEKTRTASTHAVTGLATFYHRSPDQVRAVKRTLEESKS